MNLLQFHTYQEQTFDSFARKLIKNEGRNARRDIARRSQREVALSQLMQGELAQIATRDHYNFDNATFSVQGDVVTVKDMLLGYAIALLPPQRREVILLSYFLELTDPQIAELLHTEPNTIRYRKHATLRRLRKILEDMDYEK